MDPHDAIVPHAADPKTSRATALALARALDAGDLAAACEMLAPECEFAEGPLRSRSAAATHAILRDAVKWAERGFDDVRAVTTVESATAGHAVLATTIVWMRVPARWHRLHFERGIEVRADGRISRLTFHCEPAAAQAFTRFAKESGAPPAPPGFGVLEEA